MKALITRHYRPLLTCLMLICFCACFDFFKKKENLPPELDVSHCAVTADIGKVYQCELGVSDPDSEEVTIGFDNATHTCGQWMQFDSSTGIIAGTPENRDVGDCMLGIRVYDGTHAHVTRIPFAVGDPAPKMDLSACSKSARQGKAYKCLPKVTDPDSVSFSFSFDGFSNTCGKWLDIDPATGVFSGTPKKSDVGRCLAAIVVTDGKNTTEGEIKLTVK